MAACAATLAVAVHTDLKARRIPNVLVACSAITALAFHALAGTPVGVPLAGLVVGGLLLIGPFALGGMGGGDVKLLAALGAWLGTTSVIAVFAYSAVAGALLALGVALVRRRRVDPARPFRDLATLLATGEAGRANAEPTAHTLPYAVALAAGFTAWLALGDLW